MTKTDRAARRAAQREPHNDIADANEILRCVVGSTIHGINVNNQGDRDEMGIFIEPPEYVIGTYGSIDTAVWRSQPQGVRSGPEDTDRTRHSLRRFTQLATKGNPNFLILLFAPKEFRVIDSDAAGELRALAPSIVSKNAVYQTLGYLNGQLKRLQDGRGKRFPNRPELVEKHGYDTKYASHAVRLAIQAQELAVTGRLQLPMMQWARDYVRDIRAGNETKENVISEVRWWEQQAIYAVENSTPLPDEPDFEKINRWLIRTHQTHWRRRPLE